MTPSPETLSKLRALLPCLRYNHWKTDPTFPYNVYGSQPPYGLISCSNVMEARFIALIRNNAAELIEAAEELEQHKNSRVCDDNESPCGQCAECAMLACAAELEMVAEDRDIARGEVERLSASLSDSNKSAKAWAKTAGTMTGEAFTLRSELSALKDEIARLQNLADEWQRVQEIPLDKTCGELSCEDCNDRTKRLSDENAKLKTLLAKAAEMVRYMRHDNGCPAKFGRSCNCTCGLLNDLDAIREVLK